MCLGTRQGRGVMNLQQMKIMICDDEKEAREFLRGCVENVWTGSEIQEADSAQAVLQLIRKGQTYDLLFLDIYLHEMDGIEAGKWIKDNFPEINMVFVSNSRAFGPELFEIGALHYLVKPCGVKEMEEVKRRFEDRRRQDAFLRIRSGAQGKEIPFQRIAYIESEHNNLHIYLLNGTVFTVRDSIQNYMDRLDDRFLRINRGVIINMEAVDRMNVDSCEIAGKIFLLSRKTRAESRKRYNDYLFEITVGTR